MSPGYLILFIVVFAAYFVFVALPRKRARVAQQELLASVEAGDEVLTAGGLIGTVRAVEDDIVQLELAEGVVVRLDLRAVAGRVLPDEESPDATEPSVPS
jgi:preprotein translocase subunit YajC